MKALISVIQAGILIIVGMSFAGSSIAATSQIPNDRKITLIHVYTNYAVVRYEPAFPNSLACGSTSSEFYAVINWASDKDNKAMLSAVMGANLLGNKVGFGIKNPCHGWDGGVPVIYRVDSPSPSPSP